MTDQAPPQSLPDEEAVIGALLLNQDALQRVTIDAGLKAEHFYYDKHREIYAAAQRVAAKEGVADELTVAAELPNLRDYIAALTTKAPAPSNAPVYARRLVHLADLRAKLAGAQAIIEGVHAEDAETISNGLLTASADLEADAAPTTPGEIGAWMYDWLEQGYDETDIFPLPWEKLTDYSAGGYKRGQMTLLTGWSGMGKSLVLDQMLDHWSAAGRRCLLLTTEMQLQELVARVIARKTGVAYEKTITKRLNRKEWEKVMPILREGIPWHHHDADGWSVDRILAAIAHKRPDIACIDPWNLIPHKDRFSMDETARRMKEIARRANCHVVVVAHLNTARMKEGEKPRPVQRDIRDTGMLYNNAHSVLCLHRENANGKEKRNGELFFLKSRDGVQGSIDVEFNPRFLRFDPKGAKEEAQQKIDTTPQPEDVFPE